MLPGVGQAERRIGVGIIGCGAISPVYAGTFRRSATVSLVGCADLDPAAAESLARRYRTSAYPSVEQLVADPDIDVVTVLTPPRAHASASMAALAAGKHVYVEKPLAAGLAEGKALLDKARRKRVRLAVAPDTVLGAAWQTARRLVDAGGIGVPVAADASFVVLGHELWHPNPSFYYEEGGGPLFDMGPYYLSALVLLLGPIRHVDAAAQTTYPERRPASGPNAGRGFSVSVPTHVSAVLGFVAPVTATLTMSFDAWSRRSSRFILYGSEATLVLPDPNGFGGTLELWRMGRRLDRVPPAPTSAPQRRGLGVIDLVAAAQSGQPHAASAELGLHVLEAMEAIHVAAAAGMRQTLTTRPPRPAFTQETT